MSGFAGLADSDSLKPTTLGALAEYITSGSRDWSKYYAKSGAIFIRTQDINRNRLSLDDVAYVALPERVEGKRSLVKKGDLLITITGANVGKVAAVDFDPPEAYVSQSVCLVRLKDPEIAKFVQMQLIARKGDKSSLESMAYGLGRPVLNLENIRSAPVLVGTVEQQNEIVAELEKQFSRLDEAVANLQRVKANLKRYKASVLKAAVEGRLVETEATLAHREDRTYETGEQLLHRILEERRAKWVGNGKYKEPLPLDSNSIGTKPKGWGWAAVEMVCESIVDCPHSTAKFQPDGYPCVDTTWMTTEGLVVDRARYVDEPTYLDRISRLAPKRGDIVFAREGTIGTAVLIPDRMTPCLGQRVMLLRTSKEYLNGLLVHVLHSEVVKSQYRAQALGSTVAHVNVGDVKRFAIPVPPLAEQVRILAEVDRHLSIIREVEAEVDANLQRAQGLRQAALARVFSEGY